MSLYKQKENIFRDVGLKLNKGKGEKKCFLETNGLIYVWSKQ